MIAGQRGGSGNRTALANTIRKAHRLARALVPDDEAQAALDALAATPRERQRATRRVQGVMARRRGLTHRLLAACVRVRGLVRRRYRGRTGEAMRRAFGVGLIATTSKPQTVARLAAHILAAATRHQDAIREAQVRQSTLVLVQRLLRELAQIQAQEPELRQQRRDVEMKSLAAAITVIRAADARPRASSAAGQDASAVPGLPTEHAPDCGCKRCTETRP